MCRKRDWRGRRQRGTATVEFAIVLPLLLVLMFATAELGRLISQYNTLTQSVRDAVRYAAAAAAADSTGHGRFRASPGMTPGSRSGLPCGI